MHDHNDDAGAGGFSSTWFLSTRFPKANIAPGLPPGVSTLHGPVRRLGDMTPAEIAALEEKYGAKVTGRKA